jgi:hypothetical protein
VVTPASTPKPLQPPGLPSTTAPDPAVVNSAAPGGSKQAPTHHVDPPLGKKRPRSPGASEGSPPQRQRNALLKQFFGSTAPSAALNSHLEEAAADLGITHPTDPLAESALVLNDAEPASDFSQFLLDSPHHWLTNVPSPPPFEPLTDLWTAALVPDTLSGALQEWSSPPSPRTPQPQAAEPSSSDRSSTTSTSGHSPPPPTPQTAVFVAVAAQAQRPNPARLARAAPHRTATPLLDIARGTAHPPPPLTPAEDLAQHLAAKKDDILKAGGEALFTYATNFGLALMMRTGLKGEDVAEIAASHSGAQPELAALLAADPSKFADVGLDRTRIVKLLSCRNRASALSMMLQKGLSLMKRWQMDIDTLNKAARTNGAALAFETLDSQAFVQAAQDADVSKDFVCEIARTYQAGRNLLELKDYLVAQTQSQDQEGLQMTEQDLRRLRWVYDAMQVLPLLTLHAPQLMRPIDQGGLGKTRDDVLQATISGIRCFRAMVAQLPCSHAGRRA